MHSLFFIVFFSITIYLLYTLLHLSPHPLQQSPWDSILKKIKPSQNHNMHTTRRLNSPTIIMKITGKCYLKIKVSISNLFKDFFRIGSCPWSMKSKSLWMPGLLKASGGSKCQLFFWKEKYNKCLNFLGSSCQILSTYICWIL